MVLKEMILSSMVLIRLSQLYLIMFIYIPRPNIYSKTLISLMAIWYISNVHGASYSM